MDSQKLKLVTIISEAVLEHKLAQDVERLGAQGYTISNARGKGSRGVREADWEINSNIRIEIVCNAKTAQAIANHIRENYYADYAMIIYLTDVEVLRPEKF